MKRLFLLLLVLTLAGCTLRIGSQTTSPDGPAPTSVPLAQASTVDLPGGQISLPPGFSIEVYAAELDEPRMLTLGPDGQIYLAERGAGRILRLPDRDGDGKLDGLEPAAVELNRPSSAAFHPDGSLYVGLTNRVLRLSEPDAQGVFQKREIIVPDLPPGGHNTRTVLFTPDGSTLLVSVGSSCNVCDEEDGRRGAITRYNPDGSGEQIYARGLRNAIGLTFRPGTQELWATNMGRDMMGDNLPPETVNVVREGDDFGWPRCHAGRIPDPDMAEPGSCEGIAPPAIEMQAHSAPIGLTFYTGTRFPEEYHGDLFVAFHGSWNRSTPTGYKVVRIPMDGGKPGAVEDFATGWLAGGSTWGRPVDLITGPDGSLYLTDDGAGAVYRIFYTGSD